MGADEEGTLAALKAIRRELVDPRIPVLRPAISRCTTETRIEFRVGINLGDIIIDGDDIFGDGVSATLPSWPGEFHPEHRVTGGGRPPPVPTERGVRISRTNALRQLLHSIRCYLLKFRFHGQLIFSLNRRPRLRWMEPMSPKNNSTTADRFPMWPALPTAEYYQSV